MLVKNDKEYTLYQALEEVSKMSKKKQDVDYKELYLKEKQARLQAEMAILQTRFAEAQTNLQQTTKELEEHLETEEKITKEKSKK